MHTLLDQPLPSHTPSNAVFLAPYCPTLAALPHTVLQALLRVHHLAALPAPTPDFLSACLAQRYASLPPSQFQAEVADSSSHWDGLARGWWTARFGQPSLPPSQLCHCAQIVSLNRTGGGRCQLRKGFKNLLLWRPCAAPATRAQASTTEEDDLSTYLVKNMHTSNGH
jgi:hypothetical protein